VRNIAKKCPQAATAIVRSMIVMAHNLGFEVIAEGVETSYQVDFLQSKRCDEVQGYLYAAPLAADEFKTFVLDYPKCDRVDTLTRPITPLKLGIGARAKNR
jgi:EAL domain-containing protein (putative c-di-GMP-specific phosphodiesterase class I)